MTQEGKSIGNGDSMNSCEQKRQSTDLVSSKSLWASCVEVWKQEPGLWNPLSKNLAFQIRILTYQADGAEDWPQE